MVLIANFIVRIVPNPGSGRAFYYGKADSQIKAVSQGSGFSRTAFMEMLKNAVDFRWDCNYVE
jgi:hypothetical protein